MAHQRLRLIAKIARELPEGRDLNGGENAIVHRAGERLLEPREPHVALELAGDVLREPERAGRPRQRLSLAVTDLPVPPRALREGSVSLTRREWDVLLVQP